MSPLVSVVALRLESCLPAPAPAPLPSRQPLPVDSLKVARGISSTRVVGGEVAGFLYSPFPPRSSRTALSYHRAGSQLLRDPASLTPPCAVATRLVWCPVEPRRVLLWNCAVRGRARRVVQALSAHCAWIWYDGLNSAGRGISLTHLLPKKGFRVLSLAEALLQSTRFLLRGGARHDAPSPRETKRRDMMNLSLALLQVPSNEFGVSSSTSPLPARRRGCPPPRFRPS